MRSLVQQSSVVLGIQHVPYEGLFEIERWLAEGHGRLARLSIFNNEPFPELDTFDSLVIMGGPMGCYDEPKFSWLAPEKRFIAQAIEADKRVLGICLGSQLVAEVLGGRVYQHHLEEIGWFPVQLTAAGEESRFFRGVEPTFVPFHWHGDTFELAPSCIQLAGSKGCANQAFSYGDRVLGLQFHLEFSMLDLTAISEKLEVGHKHGEFIQSRTEILCDQTRFSASRRILRTVLENFFERSETQ